MLPFSEATDECHPLIDKLNDRKVHDWFIPVRPGIFEGSRLRPVGFHLHDF
jgi:hypothetical protein